MLAMIVSNGGVPLDAVPLDAVPLDAAVEFTDGSLLIVSPTRIRESPCGTDWLLSVTLLVAASDGLRGINLPKHRLHQ